MWVEKLREEQKGDYHDEIVRILMQPAVLSRYCDENQWSYLLCYVALALLPTATESSTIIPLHINMENAPNIYYKRLPPPSALER